MRRRIWFATPFAVALGCGGRPVEGPPPAPVAIAPPVDATAARVVDRPAGDCDGGPGPCDPPAPAPAPVEGRIIGARDLPGGTVELTVGVKPDWRAADRAVRWIARFESAGGKIVLEVDVELVGRNLARAVAREHIEREVSHVKLRREPSP